MKGMVGFLIGVVLLISFSSCQKEIDWGFNNKTQSDSTILDKYIELDTTLPAGLDTIHKVLVDYDSRGRVIYVSSYDKDLSLPPTNIFPFYDSTTYFYNGNDTVPFKVIQTHKNLLNIWQDTCFLYYSAGKVIKDSIRSRYTSLLPPPMPDIELITVNTITDNGNTAQENTLQAYTFNPATWPPPCPATTNYQKTYLNGNITYEFGDFTDCNSIGTVETSHLTFDNNPNPTYVFSVPYPIMTNFLGLTGYKNNIISSWDTAPSDGYIYSYTYRSDGYPLIVRVVSLVDPTDAWKGIYIYK